MSHYKMYEDIFDDLENRLREFRCPVDAGTFVPDFDLLKEQADSEKDYLLFLIWYQAVIPVNEITRKCHEIAWEEINDRIDLI